jgi:hypothetical protein
LGLYLNPCKLWVSDPSYDDWHSLLDNRHPFRHLRYHYNWDLPRPAKNQKDVSADSWWKQLLLRNHNLTRGCNSSKLSYCTAYDLNGFPGFLNFIE